MAPGGSRLCHSPCQNLPSIDFVEDELARDPDLVGGPHSGSSSSVLSRNPTPALILAPIPASIPTPAVIDDLFKKFIKAY